MRYATPPAAMPNAMHDLHDAMQFDIKKAMNKAASARQQTAEHEGQARAQRKMHKKERTKNEKKKKKKAAEAKDKKESGAWPERRAEQSLTQKISK
jgi:hypothetical protein